jgi:hypothetical protein
MIAGTVSASDSFFSVPRARKELNKQKQNQNSKIEPPGFSEIN